MLRSAAAAGRPIGVRTRGVAFEPGVGLPGGSETLARRQMHCAHVLRANRIGARLLLALVRVVVLPARHGAIGWGQYGDMALEQTPAGFRAACAPVKLELPLGEASADQASARRIARIVASGWVRWGECPAPAIVIT